MDAATLVFDIDSSGAVGAAKALLQMEGAAAEAATATAKLQKQVLKADGTFVSFADIAKDSGKKIRDLAKEFNPVLAVQLDLAAAEKRLAQSVAAGVVPIENQGQALDVLRRQYAVAAQHAATFGAQTDVARHHVMNLGYQLNDIGMMMALGQSPFALMMQQGPQVAQIFASMNAEGKKIGPTLVGAFTSLINPTTLVTLALIGGAAAFVGWAREAWGAKESNLTFAESLTGLADAANAYATAMQLASQNSLELTAQYGAQAEELRKIYENNAAIEKLKLGVALREAASQANSEYSDLADRLRQINEIIDIAATNEEYRAEATAEVRFQMELLKDEYGLTLGQARSLSEAIQDMGESTTIEEQAEAAQRFQEELLRAQRAGATIPPELLDIASKAGVAAVAIREMAAASYDAASAWSNLQNTGAFITDYENPNGAPGTDTGTPVATYRPTRSMLPSPSRGGGGGGGSSGGGGGAGGPDPAEQIREEFQRRWEALNEGFASEYALQIQQYTQDQETLQWVLDNKLITQQQYDDKLAMMRTTAWGTAWEQTQLQYQMDLEALVAAREAELLTEQEYARKRREVQWGLIDGIGQDTQNAYAQQLGNMSEYFASMNQLAGGGYDKLLKAQQTFAAASAVINAYHGASQVLADASAPWWMKIAAAGKVLAAGLGFASAIKGSGSSSSGSGTTTSSAAAQEEPERTVLINLQGSGWMVDFTEDLLNQIYEQSKDGRVIIARDN